RFGDINVASAIDSDSVWITQLTVAGSFCSNARDKDARWRKFFDPTVVRVRNEKISRAVGSDPMRRIKLSVSSSLTAFKHTGGNLWQRFQLGRWFFGYFVNRQRIVLTPFVVKYFWKVLSVNLFVGSF